MNEADIIVIGAGIAGASTAANCAGSATVVLLEMERAPGYHATGRSAAYYAPAYGNEVVRVVTAASEAFFRAPPAGFTDVPLIHPRPSLFVAGPDQAPQVETMLAESPTLEHLDGIALRARMPILSLDKLHCGLLDSSGGDLDVDALLQGYLRLFKSRGGKLVTDQRVERLYYKQGKWHCEAKGTTWSAPIVVNAAGAWADEVAALADLVGVGLVPKRRTAVLVEAPPGVVIRDWPLVIDIDEQFYFKPDAGAILLSPADETPMAPMDVHPDELDVAIAIDRVMAVTSLDIRRVKHRWAGLRTFASDHTFVVGFDPRCSGFFWLAGQAGYGVQSAPGLSSLASHLLTGSALCDQRLVDVISRVAPGRLLRGKG